MWCSSCNKLSAKLVEKGVGIIVEKSLEKLIEVAKDGFKEIKYVEEPDSHKIYNPSIIELERLKEKYHDDNRACNYCSCKKFVFKRYGIAGVKGDEVCSCGHYLLQHTS